MKSYVPLVCVLLLSIVGLTISCSKERSFVHYLILRRLLPMPLEYVLIPRLHLFQMAIRMIERDTYQLYQKAASRLGYNEVGITDQLRALLCLMIWTQKPMGALTLDDLDNFIQELRIAYVGVDHWRMLGNGYCTRPEGVPCEYETICESCPCFSTTIEFLPILHKQKQDAENKGQTQRVDVFARLIQSMEQTPTEGKSIPS